MNSDLILARVRRFLLALSVLLFAGTLAELWLTNHTESAVQLLPFYLCAAGALASLVLLTGRVARRSWVRGAQLLFVAVLLGGAFGVYEHVAYNLEFTREVYPNAPTRELVLGALGGANPLLAPGVLAVAAAVALAATYGHPAPGDRKA